ncbi:MFS transporter [Variovorax sp. HJSM1_2]|uniref:MFS transporter n=1 Tax=Variovorax sp. HJSM1_2 TaxID=3366263 RepID=UPI003BE9E9F6
MPASPGAAEAASSHSNFTAFLASLFLSKIADQVLLFLVPLVVFQSTSDVAWSGLAFALEAFPRFLSFPICGALCDRISPVRLMRWSQLWRALVCVGGAIGGASIGGLAWLITLSAICGVLTTQGAMAREVILPQAFQRHRFEKVLAYSQTADQVGAVLGPVLAAGFLALWQWPTAVAATAGIFLLGDLALLWWQHSNLVPLHARGASHTTAWAAMLAGLRHIVLTPGLRKLVIEAAGINLVVGVTLASSAALFTGQHGQSAARYGVLQTAGAITTVVILLGIAHISLPVRRMGLAAFVLMVLGGLLTALSASVWGYALGYLLVIGLDKMFNVYLRSTRQKLIPLADFGKTTGVMAMLNNLSQPLAGLAIGVFAAQWTAGGVILALTGLMALLGLVAARIK